MRKLLILACYFSSCCIVSAQKLPAFGKIDKADLEMKDCDFDKGADAVKLIDYGSVYYDRGTAGITLFKTKYDFRIRIKILKDKGLSYANVEIPFYNNNNDERITNIDACTFNLDENGKIKITDVGKSSIYTRKITKRYSRVVIAFPEAKVGSVIEYRYKLERDVFNTISSWYFQDNIPTRYSEYEVNIPRLLTFTIQPTVTDSIDVKEKETQDVVSIENDAYTFKILKQNFIMRNLVGIRDEPFMGSANDYKQHLEFQLSKINYGDHNVENLRSSWTDVVKLLNNADDFGLQLNKAIPGMDHLISEALLISDNNKRIDFLYNAIRTKMTCTNEEALFTDEGVDKCWQKKSGNAADLNLLLINALNKAGIKAFPILLSSRDNGLVNTAFQSFSQFNVVMAYIQSGTDFLVLDATDKISNYKLTPERIVNTRGFIVSGESGRWIDVIDNKHKYQVVIALQGTVDQDGIMSGDCSLNSIDYSRKQRLEHYAKSNDNFKQDYFIKPYPTVSIQDIVIKNIEADSLPLSQKITYSTPLNKSGEYSYFNTNLFNDLEKNPFIAESRYTDIDFGVQQEYLIYGNFTIPDGYIYETLPQNVSMSLRDRSVQYNRLMTVSGNVLNMKVTVNFNRAFYAAADYQDFYEFYKKLINSLNEQVVIKKK